MILVLLHLGEHLNHGLSVEVKTEVVRAQRVEQYILEVLDRQELGRQVIVFLKMGQYTGNLFFLQFFNRTV